jgi:photosystem II stability/assembly factor-like uncharacterized protein
MMVRSLAIDPVTPTTLYAGMNGAGVFKSDDAGRTWNTTERGVRTLEPFVAVAAIAVAPSRNSTIYAGTVDLRSNEPGFVVSNDAGLSWRSASDGLGRYTFIYAIACDPGDSQIAYAGTTDGIFKTTDGGTSWSSMVSGLSPCTVNSGSSQCDVPVLAIDPAKPSTVYAGFSSGVFKSVDGAASWTKQSFSPDDWVVALAIDSSDPDTVYAGTAGSGVYRSADGGEHWSLVMPQQTGVNAIAIDPGRPGTVYVATMTAVSRSFDSGESWEDMSAGLPSASAHNAYAYLSVGSAYPFTVYLCTDDYGGVFSFDAIEQRWRVMNTGLPLSGLYANALAVDPSTPQVIFSATADGIYRSGDAGENWESVNHSISVEHLKIDPTSPATIYAPGWDFTLYKSTDSGALWQTLDFPCNTREDIAIDPATGLSLYAICPQGLVKSPDAGRSWYGPMVIDAEEHANGQSYSAIAIDPSHASTIYVGSQGVSCHQPGIFGCDVDLLAKVYKSVDGGSHWSEASRGLPKSYVTKVASISVDPASSSTVYAVLSPGGGVAKTTDGGETWRTLANIWPSTTSLGPLVLDPLTKTTMYLGSSTGVFRSLDGGSTWNPINDGLTALGVNGLTIDSGGAPRVYVATEAGISAFDRLDPSRVTPVAPPSPAPIAGR